MCQNIKNNCGCDSKRLVVNTFQDVVDNVATADKVIQRLDDVQVQTNQASKDVREFQEFIDGQGLDTRISTEVTEQIVEKVNDGIIQDEISSQVQAIQDEYAPRLGNVESELSTKVPFYMNTFIGKLENGQPATVVFLGDSTTEDNIHTAGQDGHVVQLKSYLEGLYGSLVTVINSGVSGDTAHKMWSRLYKDVIVHKPDLVVICSGLNDVGTDVTPELFHKYYDSLLKELFSSLGSQTNVVLRTPNLTKIVNWNDNKIPPIIEKTKELSIKYNIGFADLFGQMISDGYTATTINGLMSDDIHPNVDGQTLIANYMKQFFAVSEFVQEPVSSSRAYNVEYAGVTQTGWNKQTSDLFMLGKALSSTTVGSKIEFVFEGSSVDVVYALGTDRGMFKITVDGSTEFTTVDCYGVLNWRESIRLTMPLGTHTITIETITSTNTTSTGSAVYIEGFIVGGESVVNIGNIPPSESDITISAGANFTVPTDILTELPLNTTATIHGTSLSRGGNTIVVGKAGMYGFDLSLVGYMTIDKNATITIMVNTSVRRTYKYRSFETDNVNMNASGLLRLNPGDVVIVKLLHNNGSDVTFYKNTYAPFFTLGKL